MERIGHLISGKVIYEGSPIDIVDPSSGEKKREVLLAGRSSVAEAIQVAERSFPSWRVVPPAKKARIMFRFRDLLESHKEEIIRLIGSEHGKIGHDAEGELRRGIENVEYACYAPELLKGEYSKNVGPLIDSWSEMHPLGVVLGITPFNFPVMVPLWMIPLALMTGNTFVLKPSEKVPSSMMFVGQLLHQAGLPDGVLNIVNGDQNTVKELIDDPRIKAVSFVGSTLAAESVYRTSTYLGKRCQALGGAKNHAVVMPDGDIEMAVNSLVGAAFGSSGERCMAISVVVVIGSKTADLVVQGLKEKISNLKVGPCSDDSCDFGPLINRAAKERVTGFITQAEKDGAEIVVDGREILVKGYEGGFFLGATLIDKVGPQMECYQKEIFGPVLLVVRAETLQEAISLIDRHEYGNGTCIYTRDGEAARTFTDQVQAGMVGVNVALPVPVSYHSFGGWKRSIFGDLSAYGPDGVRFYTRRKTVSQRWPSGHGREGVRLSFPS